MKKIKITYTVKNKVVYDTADLEEAIRRFKIEHLIDDSISITGLDFVED